MLESENKSLMECIGFREQDIHLLRLIFANDTTENDVIELLSRYDIYNEHLNVNLLLAFLVDRHSEIKHPFAQVLKGVVRYFKYKNTFLLEGFWKIGRELNRREIPILMIKGLAMRYLYPKYLRYMSDVDFVVPPSRMEEAVEAAIDIGAHIALRTFHSVDMVFSDNMKIDIHSVVIKEDCSADDRIWRSAHREMAFGVNVFIPSTENLIFSILTNFYCGLIYDDFFWDTSEYNVSSRSLAWICDVANLLKNNEFIDWNIVIANGEKTGLAYQIKQLLEIFQYVLPEILPKTLDGKFMKWDHRNFNDKIKRDKKIMQLFKLRDRLLQRPVVAPM
ncbi:hypothetical protein FACS1894122_13900 [Alphaproteobacteria bacterium]|nr:hypothetical protein FACS1894122_13900 [Alphaproteobacteria bacterium]